MSADIIRDEILRNLIEWWDTFDHPERDGDMVLEAIVDRARAAITSPQQNTDAVMASFRAAFKGAKDH